MARIRADRNPDQLTIVRYLPIGHFRRAYECHILNWCDVNQKRRHFCPLIRYVWDRYIQPSASGDFPAKVSLQNDSSLIASSLAMETISFVHI